MKRRLAIRSACCTNPTLVAVWLLCAACIRAEDKTVPGHFGVESNLPLAPGQLIVFAPANDDLIGCIDVDRLAQIVFPDCRRVDLPFRFVEIGVDHQYELGFGEGRVHIFIAITESREAATAVGFRALPAAGLRIERTADSTYVFSGRARNMFIRNVYVRIQMNKSWGKLSSSYSQLDPAARRLKESVAESLRRALHDPEVATIREFVNTPKLEFADVSQALENGRLIDGAYNVILRGDAGLLFAGWGQPAMHTQGDGLYEFVVKPSAPSRNAEVRFARPTGEIGVFRFDDIRWEPGDRTRRVWWERERMRLHRQKYGLSDDERNEIIESLRKKEGTHYEQSTLLIRLRIEGAEESVPLFLEILHSTEDASMKNAALHGLSTAIGRAGLNRYRGFAADRMQPQGVRVLSVRLIGRDGENDDISFLRRIAVADGKTLPPLYPPEEQKRQLVQNRRDDLLLYEIWGAIRLLKYRASHR